MNTKSLTCDRIRCIDLLETTAMFLVIVIHSASSSYDIISEPVPVMNYVTFYLSSFTSVCVPVFFAVHGFLLMGSSFSMKKHLKKMLRLFLLTCFWSAATTVLLLLLRHQSMSFRDFFMVQWNQTKGWTNHLWFMGPLIIAYIFFPLLKSAYDHNFPAFVFFTVVCTVMTYGNNLLNTTATFLKVYVAGRNSLTLG